MLAYQLQKTSVNWRWNFVPYFRSDCALAHIPKKLASKSQDVVAMSFGEVVEVRIGSRAEDEPCPRRRQLSLEAVAGCGRRLRHQPLSTALAIDGGTCRNCGRWGRRPRHLQWATSGYFSPGHLTKRWRPMNGEPAIAATA